MKESKPATPFELYLVVIIKITRHRSISVFQFFWKKHFKFTTDELKLIIYTAKVYISHSMIEDTNKNIDTYVHIDVCIYIYLEYGFWGK